MLLTQPMTIAEPEVWYVDNIDEIGHHPAATFGKPRQWRDSSGTSVRFGGVSDGLLVEHNPIAKMHSFTIEVCFFPESGGGFEQRFVHMQEHASESRALVELRSVHDHWYLDTYLHAQESQLTLIEPKRLHSHGQWYWAALTYDGAVMRHFVNGEEEACGRVFFAPLGSGRTSIGMRQNQVSWYKGSVREIRIFPTVLGGPQLSRPAQ